jgi:hypothetical protein
LIAVSSPFLRCLRLAAGATFAGFLCIPSWCAAAPQDRDLHVTIDIAAQEKWTKGQQWSKTQSTQHYEIETVLRTDGRQWGANLLDLNTQKRLAIKTEWLRRKGLEELKRRNGGKIDVPTTDAQKEQMQNKLQEEMSACNGDGDCLSGVVERYSALMSANDTGAHYGYDGGALLDTKPAHFEFFNGFPGCLSKVHMVINTHAEGFEAHEREGKEFVPFTETHTADFRGDANDRTTLCNRYHASVDTAVPDIYVDNVYIPTPRGTTTRTENKHAMSEEQDQILIIEAVDLATATLRHAKESGTLNKTIHLQYPLDGNSTVGGDFDGVAKVSLIWSFLPVATAPPPAAR